VFWGWGDEFWAGEGRGVIKDIRMRGFAFGYGVSLVGMGILRRIWYMRFATARKSTSWPLNRYNNKFTNSALLIILSYWDYNSIESKESRF
jgi:hypothetical protein